MALNSARQAAVFQRFYGESGDISATGFNRLTFRRSEGQAIDNFKTQGNEVALSERFWKRPGRRLFLAGEEEEMRSYIAENFSPTGQFLKLSP